MDQNGEKENWLQKVSHRKYSLRTIVLISLLIALVSGITAGNLVAYNYTAEFKRKLYGMSGENLDPLNLQRLLKAGMIEEPTAVVPIAQKVGPSIVGIQMTVRSTLDRVFGGGTESGRAEGSGIIISKDGYIMTNYHVVQYADPREDSRQKADLEVFLPDKRQTRARFVGGDPWNDLAVIKIDLKNLPVAELGDSSRLKVGALAVAIGNPLGLEFAGSVTAGVVSALNRTVMIEDRMLDLIQTDAAINPGNSGGALVNAEGQVVGINTIKISVPGVEGLGFAIPINDAKPIMDHLIRYGYVKGRPLMGIRGRDITESMAQYYNLPTGIYIAGVTPGSGAEKAGIRKRDILISLAGKRVTSMQELNAIMRKYRAGDMVTVVVARGKRRVNLKVTFSEAR